MNDLTQAYFGAFIAGGAVMCAGSLLLWFAWMAQRFMDRFDQETRAEEASRECNDK